MFTAVSIRGEANHREDGGTATQKKEERLFMILRQFRNQAKDSIPAENL
jgi:hypothetical protein